MALDFLQKFKGLWVEGNGGPPENQGFHKSRVGQKFDAQYERKPYISSTLSDDGTTAELVVAKGVSGCWWEVTAVGPDFYKKKNT